MDRVAIRSNFHSIQCLRRIEFWHFVSIVKRCDSLVTPFHTHIHIFSIISHIGSYKYPHLKVAIQ
ncbi:hypothetical protein HanIR_Chr17g0863591 [Helianthus annuus]|nr:hypothetical protein HanIR_Chr17g0863591 [Helianthus annuus]